MGNTVFQKRVFTALMCFFMVLGMTAYNIALHEGLSAHLFASLVKEIWLVFAVALVLDMFVVGPLAKAFVFGVLKPAKKVFAILAIGTSMVVCMVTLMSAFGSVMGHGLTAGAIEAYPLTWVRNFVVALPYNILIVSPVVRALFVRLFPELKAERAAA